MTNLDCVFTSWLSNNPTSSAKSKYVHHFCLEDIKYRKQAIKKLRIAVSEAHKDATKYITLLDDDALSPVHTATRVTMVVQGYPNKLPITTLMGYFGEIFAHLAATYGFLQDGIKWEVPAYLFRFHSVAFHYLEKLNIGEAEEDSPIPGRHGDDCIAFARNTKGEIVEVLVGESKCLQQHNSTEVSKAHEKLSTGDLIPKFSILNILEILKDNRTAKAKNWAIALRLLLMAQNKNCERRDLVSYIANGNKLRSGSKTWIPQNICHTDYTAGRPLQVLEVRLSDVREFVKEVYSPS